jgi:hypothetical protein
MKLKESIKELKTEYDNIKELSLENLWINDLEKLLKTI